MNLKVNTSEVIDAGEKIISLSNEIEKLINDLFNDINGLFENGAWQGISANKYAENIKNDPEELKKFCETLRSYGGILVKRGNDLKNLTSKYQRYDKNLY